MRTYAYQLLIADAETMASEACKDLLPNEDAMIGMKKGVYKLGRKFGLSEEQAQQLAIEACKDNSWTGLKFSRFLAENAGEEIWTADDLFKTSEVTLPDRANFEAALREIYSARGSVSHTGGSYPTGAEWGRAP